MSKHSEEVVWAQNKCKFWAQHLQKHLVWLFMQKKSLEKNNSGKTPLSVQGLSSLFLNTTIRYCPPLNHKVIDCLKTPLLCLQGQGQPQVFFIQ